MNKTFHSVWNASKQAWVAAAETVSAKGKPTSGVKVAAVISALFGGLLTLSAHAQNAPPANALPTGGQVNAGQASISTSGANMVIQQSSSRASINWQSFNVGSNAQVQFQQPDANSVTLNRVMSADPSQIFGRISANGQIVLTNPAGIYFAPNARVDVGGLIATTHDISDADFMAGKSRFDRNASTGSVVNEGELKAALGGYIALLAPEVRNQGAIIAQMGTVAMASGEAVDLKFDSNSRLTSLRVDASQIAALVDNRHAVQAPGGLVIISAQSIDRLVGGVVKNSGHIEATGMQSDGGRIVLTGSHKVSNSGSLNVSSTTAQGGSISLQSADIELNDGTRIDATGATGGGTVLVGGNWQGSTDPSIANTNQPTNAAVTVSMASGATIDASATQQGNGGTVVLWSDVKNSNSQTTAQGSITARGGVSSGNGGQVETSGHSLNTDGIHVDAGANQGQGGLWLLDPADASITQTTANGYATTLNTGTSVVNDVTGNITWGSNVSLSKTSGGNATLTLKATGNITLSASSNISSSNNKLNVVLWSDSDNSGQGYIGLGLNSSITTNGGDIVMGGGTASSGLPGGYATGAGSLSGANTYSGLGLNTTTLDTTINNALGATAGNITLRGSSTYSSTTAGDIAHGISLLSSHLIGNNLTLDGKTTSTSTTGLVTYGISSNGGADPSNTQLNAYGDISLTGTAASPTTSSQNAIRWGTNHTMSSTNGNITVNAVGQIDWLSSQILTIAQDKTLTINNSWNGNWSNVIAGAGGLIKQGAGTLTLNNINTYFGPTTISAGTLTLGSAGTIANSSGVANSGNFSIAANKTIDSMTGTGTTNLGSYTLTIGDTSNTSATYGGIISGTGGITKDGSGTLTLSGINTYTGATTISAGTLALDSTGTIANSSGVANSGNFSIAANKTIDSMTGTGTTDLGSYTLTIGDASNTSATYGGVISGTGGITKAGTGTLTLSGINTYTGATTISAGTLALDSTGTIASSYSVANSGNFSIAANKTIDSMTGTGTTNLGSYTLTIGDTSNTSATYGGIISGTGGITKDGSGTLTLSGINTYTGATTISAGTLALDSTGTIANSSGVANSGNFSIAANKTIDSMTGTGTTDLGSYTLTIGDASNTSATYGGVISGTGGITKAGTGTLTLSGINTYSGVTTVSAGTLKADQNNALGTTAGNTVVASGATLSVSDGVDIAEPLQISGTGASSLGALNLLGTNTYSGAITLSANSTIIGGTGTQTLSGNVNGGYGLTVTSSGSWVQSGALGNSATLSSVSLRSAGAASLGAITATGTIDVATLSGNLTLNNAISTTNATSSAIVLNASKDTNALTSTGGDIIINGGSLSVGTGGRATVYSGSLSGSTGLTGLIGSGSGRFRYGSDETTSNYTTALNTGLNAVFREQPTASTSSLVLSMTYGDALPSITGTGTVNGDAASYSITARLNSASGNIKASGTPYAITENLTGLGYLVNSSNSASTGTLTVAAKALTMSGLSVAASKVYNGNTSATVSGTATLLSAEAVGSGTNTDGKRYTGDTVSITGTAVGTYNSQDVANASTVTFSGLSLTGADASNYSLTIQSPASATITAKALTMSGLTVSASRIYDGTTAATVSGTAALLSSEAVGTGTTADGKPYTGDTVALTGTAVGTYNSKDVATANAVTFSGLSLNNSNYSLTVQSPASATITAKALTMSGLIVPTSKVYDGTTAATVSGTATLQVSETTGTGTTADGKPYTGDVVAITGTAVGTYNNKNVSSATTVTFSGLSLNNSNYSLTVQSPASATITAKALTMSGLTASASKVYDGTTTATVSGAATLLSSEAVGAGTTLDGKPYTGDVVAITGSAVGTYNSKDVASAATVTFSGLSLNNSNYSLTIQSPASATITAKALTMSGLTISASKIYDGSTAAAVSGTATLLADEVVGTGTTADGKPYTGDIVAITGTAIGTYNNKNVASATTVTFSGLSLNNSNYSLTIQSPASATITAKALTMSGLSVAANKVYNGTTSATVSGTAALQSAEAVGTGTTADGKPYTGDTVAITGSAVGTYDNKDVSSATSVTFSGLSLNNSNYSLTIQSPAAATITAKALTMSGLTASASKVYDGTTAATVSGSATLLSSEAAGAGTTADGKPYTGDVVAITGSAVGTYNNKNVANATTVTFSGLSLNNSNYSLTIQSPASATITAKALTMSGLTVSASRIYDGTTSATVSGTAALLSAEAAGTGTTADGKPYTGDVVAITGTAVGTYNNKNVSSATIVTFSGLSLNNSNYSLTVQSPASATITAKALTMSGLSSQDKVYDGTTSAAVSGTAALLSAEAAGTGTSSDGKPYTGDTVALSGTVAANFNSKDVVSANQVAFTGLSLTGTSASNYTLTPHAVNTSARITAAPLSVTVNDDAKFVVETDRVGFNGVTYSGFVNGETSSVLGGSATITRSNALTNTSGIHTGVLSAAGLTSSNYSITYHPGNFTITPANELLVSVTNASTTYGTSAQYAISSVKYYNDPTNDGINNGTVYTLGSGGVAGSSVSINSSNLVTVNDGAGGTATFTLTPISGVFSQANKLSVGSYQLGVAGTVTANSANFSNTITVTGSHQVNTKGITASASSVSKAYDGTTSMSGVALNLSTLETNDVVTVNGAGAFANKNAGTGLNYTISNLALSGTDASNYHLTGGSSFSGSNGVITAVPLTITASNASKTYDGVAYSGGNGVSYSGFVGGESASALGGSLSYGGTSQGATNAATGYTIVPSGLSSSNYIISYVNGALDIAKANATVTANSNTTTYNGLSQSVSGFTATGLVNNETTSVLSGVTAGASGTNAGTYTATVSGTDSNYNLTFIDGALIINKANATVTANSGTTTYNGLSQSVSGFTATGLVNNETTSVLSGVTAGASGTNAGTYTTIASGTDGNYNLTFVNGTLTINKANATVTANSNTTTYNGLSQSVSGFTATGLVNNETTSVLSGVTANGSGTNAGTYTSTASGTDSNYNLTFVNGTLTINPATVVVTTISGTLQGSVSKVYDGTNAATLSAANYALTGWVGSDGATVTKTSGTYDNAAAGIGKTVTVSLSNADFTATGSTNFSNYTLPSSISGAVGTITKAPLTVTANNASKSYDGVGYSGGNGVSYSGFVNGESASSLGGNLSYGGTSQGATDIGTGYTIVPSGLTSSNYTLSYADGNLAINPAVVLAINTPVVPTRTPEIINPAITSPNNHILTIQSAITVTGTSASSAPISTNSAGVTVDVHNSGLQVATMMVAVSVPKGTSTTGTGFTFEMPETVKSMTTANTSLEITQDNGAPIPTWLKFDQSKMQFEATSVPDSSLPIQLQVTVAGQRLQVVISERTE